MGLSCGKANYDSINTSQMYFISNNPITSVQVWSLYGRSWFYCSNVKRC